MMQSTKNRSEESFERKVLNDDQKYQKEVEEYNPPPSIRKPFKLSKVLRSIGSITEDNNEDFANLVMIIQAKARNHDSKLNYQTVRNMTLCARFIAAKLSKEQIKSELKGHRDDFVDRMFELVEKLKEELKQGYELGEQENNGHER